MKVRILNMAPDLECAAVVINDGELKVGVWRDEENEVWINVSDGEKAQEICLGYTDEDLAIWKESEAEMEREIEEEERLATLEEEKENEEAVRETMEQMEEKAG